jgi:hypothetical protein
MQPRTLFTVTDTFALRGRGTVLVGPRLSQVRDVVSVGDEVELKFPDGRTVRSRVTGVEPFMGPPTSDPGVGVGLADVIEVPQGTTVHPAA